VHSISSILFLLVVLSFLGLSVIQHRERLSIAFPNLITITIAIIDNIQSQPVLHRTIHYKPKSFSPFFARPFPIKVERFLFLVILHAIVKETPNLNKYNYKPYRITNHTKLYTTTIRSRRTAGSLFALRFFASSFLIALPSFFAVSGSLRLGPRFRFALLLFSLLLAKNSFSLISFVTPVVLSSCRMANALCFEYMLLCGCRMKLGERLLTGVAGASSQEA